MKLFETWIENLFRKQFKYSPDHDSEHESMSETFAKRLQWQTMYHYRNLLDSNLQNETSQNVFKQFKHFVLLQD